MELGRTAIFEAGITGPRGHALSRPAALEAEATGRAITLARRASEPRRRKWDLGNPLLCSPP